MSRQGEFYGRVCERWGIDPGAVLQDDVLAFDLRAALLFSIWGKDEVSSSRELADKARAGGAAVRAMVDG